MIRASPTRPSGIDSSKLMIRASPTRPCCKRTNTHKLPQHAWSCQGAFISETMIRANVVMGPRQNGHWALFVASVVFFPNVVTPGANTRSDRRVHRTQRGRVTTSPQVQMGLGRHARAPRQTEQSSSTYSNVTNAKKKARQCSYSNSWLCKINALDVRVS